MPASGSATTWKSILTPVYQSKAFMMPIGGWIGGVEGCVVSGELPALGEPDFLKSFPQLHPQGPSEPTHDLLL